MTALPRWRAQPVFIALCLLTSWGTALSAPSQGTKQAALDPTADPRLAQATPLSVRGEPLGDMLRTLAERTGIPLEAAREVAELKVMVLAGALPLHRALAEIADLLDLTWLRRGSAPGYRYECARDVAATQRARAALDQARTRNRATVLGQLTRVAEALRKGDTAALAATDPDIAAAFSDPGRAPGARGIYQGLAMMPAEALSALVQAGRITATYDQMPPQAQQQIRSQLEGFLPTALGNIRGPGGNSPGYETFLKSATYTLGVNGLDSGENAYFGEIRAGNLSLHFSTNLGTALAPPTPAPGAPAAGAAAAPTPRARPALPPISAKLEGGKSMSVREIADWLAEKAPFTVVSDYYATRYERRQIPVPPAADAGAALAAMEKYAEVEYTLAPDNQVLRLRSRRWPLDDLMEPPPAAVQALERALKTSGRLGLPEYLLAAQLTEAQNAGLARMDERKFGPIGGALDGSRPLIRDALRLIPSLPPAQRAAAESPGGLPLVQLGRTQQALVVEAVRRQIPDVRPEDLAAGVFRITRPERGAPLPDAPPVAPGSPTTETYVFSIQLPDARREVAASLTLGR